MDKDNILEVKDLHVDIRLTEGLLTAVRGVNFEMTVSDAESLYRRVLDAGIAPFREIMVNRYRNGDSDIVQREFLVQDPDGYLLRFTD